MNTLDDLPDPKHVTNICVGRACTHELSMLHARPKHVCHTDPALGLCVFPMDDSSTCHVDTRHREVALTSAWIDHRPMICACHILGTSVLASYLCQQAHAHTTCLMQACGRQGMAWHLLQVWPDHVPTSQYGMPSDHTGIYACVGIARLTRPPVACQAWRTRFACPSQLVAGRARLCWLARVMCPTQFLASAQAICLVLLYSFPFVGPFIASSAPPAVLVQAWAHMQMALPPILEWHTCHGGDAGVSESRTR